MAVEKRTHEEFLVNDQFHAYGYVGHPREVIPKIEVRRKLGLPLKGGFIVYWGAVFHRNKDGSEWAQWPDGEGPIMEGKVYPDGAIITTHYPVYDFIGGPPPGWKEVINP